MTPGCGASMLAGSGRPSGISRRERRYEGRDEPRLYVGLHLPNLRRANVVLQRAAYLPACGLRSLALILSFVVFGVPQPKGSTQSFGYLAKDEHGEPRTRTTRTGKVVPVIRTATKSDNPKNADWQKQVAAEAMVAAANATPRFRRLEAGIAVSLQLAFYLPRPQDAPAGARHTKRPDFDKLARSIADALTGVLWDDDGQVDHSVIDKRYANPIFGKPRVEITVYPSEEPL